jgi:hypothetical protein
MGEPQNPCGRGSKDKDLESVGDQTPVIQDIANFGQRPHAKGQLVRLRGRQDNIKGVWPGFSELRIGFNNELS